MPLQQLKTLVILILSSVPIKIIFCCWVYTVHFLSQTYVGVWCILLYMYFNSKPARRRRWSKGQLKSRNGRRNCWKKIMWVRENQKEATSFSVASAAQSWFVFQNIISNNNQSVLCCEVETCVCVYRIIT